MSNQLKLKWCGLPQIENKKGRKFNEICRIHRCTCKADDEKGGERVEKARPIIENEKQDPRLVVPGPINF